MVFSLVLLTEIGELLDNRVSFIFCEGGCEVLDDLWSCFQESMGEEWVHKVLVLYGLVDLVAQKADLR